MRTVIFRVDGIPPKKGTDYSLWNKQIDDVKKLAGAAKKAMNAQEAFRGGVELIMRLKVRENEKGNIGDAANFIGGVADVLQGWKCSITKEDHEPKDEEIKNNYKKPIVYRNDKQIRRVSYIEDPLPKGERAHYFVMVVEIDSAHENKRTSERI